jgi:hypothetical protein
MKKELTFDERKKVIPLPDKPQTKFFLTCLKKEPEIFLPKKNKSWSKKFGYK